jgi:hypothetical protein
VASGVLVSVAVLVAVGVGSAAGAQPTMSKTTPSKKYSVCRRMALPFGVKKRLTKNNLCSHKACANCSLLKGAMQQNGAL